MDIQFVAVAFVDAINTHDLDGMTALMASTHRYIKSCGEVICGVDAVLSLWETQFRWDASARIDIQRIITDADTVVLIGDLIGRCQMSHEPLRVPSVWVARVCAGQLIEWRMYADASITAHSAGAN